MKSETSFPRFTSKHLLFVLIILTLGVGGVGSFWVGKATDSRARAILLERTRTAAVGIPIADVMALSGTARDENNPAYLRLRDQMARLREAAPDVRFCYLMRLVDEKIVFLCDSEPSDSPNFSPPGSVYEDEDPEFRAFVRNREAGTLGPQKDSWGVWVTSVAPLRDPQGKVVAFLGADVDAHYWAGKIAQFQTIPFLFSLLVSGLLILLYIIQLRDLRARQVLTHVAEERAFLLDKIETQVWLLKDEETFGVVNHAFAEFCGYPKPSIEHHPLWTVFTSDEELQAQIEANRRVFKEKRPIRSEEWRISADCHSHLFQVLRAPLLDSEGEVEEVVCCAEDITEINQTYEALKESRRTLAAYFDNLPGLAYRCRNDSRWTIEFMSKGSQELTGYPPEAFLGDSPKTFMDLIPPEEQARLWQIVQEANAEKRHYEVRYPLLTASGARKWVWERGRGVFGPDGAVLALEGLITDISETHQAEQALRLNEMRLEALLQLDHMEEKPRQDILAYTLTEAVRLTRSEMGYLAFVSPDERVLTLEAWSESAREEGGQESLPLVYTVEEAGAWGKILRKRQPFICNNTGAPSRSPETRFPSTRTPLQRTMSAPIFDGPKIVIVSGVANKPADYDESDIRQITLLMTGMWRILQRKQANQELLHYHERLQDQVESRTRQLAESNRLLREAKEAAEAANQAKSIFLATVTHELRTPLNAVLGFSQIMRDDPSLSENQKENVETINRSGELLLDLINDVLEMSKIESGQTSRYDSCFDVRRMLLGIEEIMRPHAQAKRLSFRLELDPLLPLYIRTDEKRLKQVLINLTGNAVKFTQEGLVSLRARVQEKKETLRFEVQDTGPGIAEENRESLFDPFMQAHGNAAGGVGLGLYISRKLVNLLGGELALCSEPGSGSLFSFNIPYEAVTDENQPTPMEPLRTDYWISVPNPPEILICEDQVENLAFLVQLLQSAGLRTREASDGAQAVRSFEENRPDLILMDLRMPVLDGYEAIQRIRQQERSEKRVPIIVISASVSDDDRQTLLLRGADDFIAKPFQTRELFNKLVAHLGWVVPRAEPRKAEEDFLNTDRLDKMLNQLPAPLISQLEEALSALDLDGFKTFLPQVCEWEPLLGHELKKLASAYEVAELAKLFNARKLS